MTGLRVRSPDRLLGRMVAVCGLLACAAAWQRMSQQTPQFATWWSVIAFGVVAVLVILSVAGRVLPDPLLRAAWWSVVGGVAIVQATLFTAYQGRDPDAVRPWVWVLEIAAMCLLALLIRARAALLLSIVLMLSPPISGLLVHGRIPDTVLAMAPIHVGNLAVVVVLVALRRRLREVERSAERARRLDIRMLRERARREHQDDLARMIHDDVLSTLTAAPRLVGASSAPLREAAHASLKALRAVVPVRRAREEVGSDQARRVLIGTAARSIPADRTDITISGGTVPRAVVERSSHALEEALRNSAMHAPTAVAAVSGTISGEAVRLVVSDDGAGFDVSTAQTERMGVHLSILRRMRALVGGTAQVSSGPGGTRVDLGWTRIANARTDSGLATPLARAAVVVIWATGVLHGLLTGALPGADPWAGVLGHAIALIAAVLVTSGPHGPLPASSAAGAIGCCLLIGLCVSAGADAAAEIWLLTYASYLLGILAARGNALAGAAGAAALIGVIGAWGVATGQNGAELFAMLTPTIGSLLVGCVWLLAVVLIVRRERGLVDMAHRAAVMIAAARSGRRDSARVIADILRSAEPALERIAEGDPIDDDFAGELRILEARIRDRVRAPSLHDPALAAAIDRARRRGVEVLLLADDAIGASRITSERAVALAVAIDADSDARSITVRERRPGEPLSMVTILPDGLERLRLIDRTGQVVNGQISGT